MEREAEWRDFLALANKSDFSVLVDIPEDTNVGPTYYIVPTPVIDKWLKDDFQTWVTTPGAKGQQRKKENRQRIVHLDGNPTRLGFGYRQKLAPYKGAWETLARGEHATWLPAISTCDFYLCYRQETRKDRLASFVSRCIS